MPQLAMLADDETGMGEAGDMNRSAEVKFHP